MRSKASATRGLRSNSNYKKACRIHVHDDLVEELLCSGSRFPMAVAREVDSERAALLESQCASSNRLHMEPDYYRGRYHARSVSGALGGTMLGLL